MRPTPQSRYVTAPISPDVHQRGDGIPRSQRRTAPPPFPPGSREAQVWTALAYRGEIPTVESVNTEVRRRAGIPTAGSTKRLTRAAVAGRLANQGPAVARFVASYWAAHRTGPTWADIARALNWPGDAIDHERALTALAGVEWIIDSGSDPTRPGPRWTERHREVMAPPTQRVRSPAASGPR